MLDGYACSRAVISLVVADFVVVGITEPVAVIAAVRYVFDEDIVTAESALEAVVRTVRTVVVVEIVVIVWPLLEARGRAGEKNTVPAAYEAVAHYVVVVGLDYDEDGSGVGAGPAVVISGAVICGVVLDGAVVRIVEIYPPPAVI